MKVLSLRARGFIGFKKGLGLDEINVDFSNISGLVALAGDNGTGKSTLIELLHPFNCLASREGALFHHVYTRNAEKELCFTYGGHHYRTLVKIDCQSEKQEGFIWVDGKPAVNGKISAYAKFIKDLLGTTDLFFNSVFCAQGSKKLSDMTTGKLKELFSEFLRLDRLIEYENTAKQCANVLAVKAGQIDIRIVGLKERLQGSDTLKDGITAAGKDLESLEADRDCKKGELSSYRTEVESLKTVIANNAAAVQRKTDIQAAIDTVKKEIAEIKTQADKELTELRRQYTEAEKEGRKYAAVLEKKEQAEGAAERQKAVNNELGALSFREEECQHEADTLNKEISEQEQIQAALLLEIKTWENDKELRSLQQNVTALQTERSHCEGKVKDLERRDPECKSTTCSFIVGALSAQDKLTALENQLTEALDKHGDRSAEVTEKYSLNLNAKCCTNQLLAEKRRDLAAVQKKQKEIKAQKTVLQEELKALASLISLLPEIQIAKARHEDATKRLTEIANKGTETKAEWDEKEREKVEQKVEHERRLEIVNALIDITAERKLKEINGQIDSIEVAELPGIERLILARREKIAALQSDLSKMADAEKELEKEQEEKDKLTREISEWTYLRNACSKNGLQALEIDGTAPLITSFANELLSQSFGPMYSVKLVTQDEEGKETLDIVVVNEDGDEISLDNLSGGQKIWNLMALRLGMTLLSKDKSGHVFLTAFSDESDGALDPENAINYVSMYRSFMKVGGFENFLFISHRPECRNMADYVLTFEPGKNPEWR
jgi:DNA repair protein SbcC/Rad50